MKSIWAICMVIVLLQFVSRYIAAPAPYFTMDDWGLYEKAIGYAGWSDIARQVVHEPDRPAQVFILLATFRALGMNPWAHWLLSITMYSLFICVGVALVWRLTNSRSACWIYGIVISALPNLTESFHWSAMITVAYMQIAYILSALCWVDYIERKRGWLLGTSVLLYAMGLSSYEFGFALPLSFLMLVPSGNYKKMFIRLVPYAGVFCIYMCWRLTQAFGLGHGVFFASRKIEITTYSFLHNGLDVLSWWIGPRMIRAIAQGWIGFTTLSASIQTILLLVNLSMAVCMGWMLMRDAQLGKKVMPYSAWRIIAFGLVWSLFGCSTSLVSWTAGRLNLYPAVGAAILLAGIGQLWPAMARSCAIPTLLFFCLVANQGTAKQWQASGDFQMALFQHLRDTKAEWIDKDIVVIDTRKLRHRLTPGLATPIGLTPETWAMYGNALLIRGFVPAAQLNLAREGEGKAQSVLDTEYGVKYEGDHILWHERYDSERPRSTHMDNAYVVDCMAIQSSSAQR